MKKTKLWIATMIFAVASGCSKEIPELLNEPIVIDEPIDEPTEPVDSTIQVTDSLMVKRFVGTWVETYPELYDGISDTLVFTEDFKIEKHYELKGFSYLIDKDSLIFYDPETGRKLINFYEFKNEKEFVTQCFLQKSVVALCFITSFSKIDNSQ